MRKRKDGPQKGRPGNAATRKSRGTAELEASRSLLRKIPVEVWIFLFYLAVTVFITWPLMIKFGHSIYGYPADNIGGIWAGWWVRNAASFGAKKSFCPLIGYPFGTALGSGVPMEPLSFIIDRSLLLVTNEVVAFNMRMFLSFFLSGVTMYYLVRYLTGDRRVAVFGGFAYLLIPYHAYISMYIGGGISEVQWMPLYILFLLKFIKEPTVKRSVWLGVGALLVAGTSVHNGLFMGVFTIAFLAGRFACDRLSYRRKEKEGGPGTPLRINRKTLALSFLVVLLVVVVMVPLFLVSMSGGKQQAKWPTTIFPNELRTDFAAYWASALPQSYFIPGNFNVIARILGAGPPDKLKPDWFSSVYVGWTLILILAVFAVMAIRKKRSSSVKKKKVKKDGQEIRSTVVGFAVVVPVAYIMSLRPYFHIGSTRIPLPSMLFRFIVPWFRWYLRLGVVVGICLIVLASMALSFMLKKQKAGKYRSWFVLVILMVVLAFDMLLVPPFRSFDFKKIPPVFESVAKTPKDARFVCYPLSGSGTFINSQYLFYQRWTKKALLNGAYSRSDGEALRRTVYNPYLEATPRILRRFGIDNMVYFPDWFGMQGITGLPGGLELVETSSGGALGLGRAYLFKITAPKANLVPIYTGDISVPSSKGLTAENRTVKRVVVKDGIIKVLNYTGQNVLATVTVPIENFSSTRRVSMTVNDNVMWQKDLTSGERTTARFNLPVPPEGVDIHIRPEGRLSALSYVYTDRFGVESASIKILDVEIADGSEPRIVPRDNLQSEADSAMNADAEATLEKDRAEVQDLVARAEQIIAASKGPDKDTCDRLSGLLIKYSTKWEKEKREPAGVINEHADRQLKALTGAGETPLFTSGREYDIKQLSRLPDYIKRSAAGYLTAFRNIFDLHAFSSQYLQSGGYLTKIPQDSFVPPKGDIKYKADDNGQLYLNRQPISYKDLQMEFINAAKRRIAEGDRANK
jgi:hypothetical protein